VTAIKRGPYLAPFDRLADPRPPTQLADRAGSTGRTNVVREVIEADP
jgi:hypothetical protein